MAYILTGYPDGGPAHGVRVGRQYATLEAAKLAACVEAEAHGRVIGAWTSDRPARGEPAWATGTTTDGRERYLAERAGAGAGS